MKPIKILADSTCDLSPELRSQYHIDILPLCVNLGEVSRLDGVDIQPDEIYAWADKNNKTPTTSAPTPPAVKDFLEPFAEEYDIIVFTISGEMSSTYQTFCAVAKTIPQARITVIDSRNLSTGIGLQVLTAAKMVQNGASYEEILAKLKEINPLVRAGFVVENVLFLHKGGRCSALAAWGATALKLRPTLAVVDGVIKVDRKVRGDIRTATMKYVTGMEKEILAAQDDMVFITHSGTSQEIIDEVYTYVKSLNKFKNIYITRAGCVISSHCGAGTLGVLFIAEK